MRIALGSDHGGFNLKCDIKRFLLSIGIEFVDFGTDSEEACDYPDFGFAAAKAVSNAEADFGVVICKSGIGISIVANKVRKVRAALCFSKEDAETARKHNHANVLALSANKITPEKAAEIIEVFINTAPEPGRHKRRVQKITEMESESLC